MKLNIQTKIAGHFDSRRDNLYKYDISQCKKSRICINMILANVSLLCPDKTKKKHFK